MEGEPIYEKLAPGDVLVLSRIGNDILYIANKDGVVVFEKVSLEDYGGDERKTEKEEK